VNYRSEDDGTNEDDFDWDDDDRMMEWARSFLEGAGAIRNNGTKKMGSSAITNILPRMERLKGPYGMYATVYGIQTKVLHVAHPVPARAILTGTGVLETGDFGEALHRKDDSFSWKEALLMVKKAIVNHADSPASSKDRALKRRRSSSLRMLTGSTKYPAYDHFKNFSGDGVFTANGSDWKAKRASVIHCLLRNGNTEKSLEREANRAADSFEREVARAMERRRGRYIDENCYSIEQQKSPVMNVVPMLQRSTIGLIYRIITHHDVEFSPGSNISLMCGECRENDDSISRQSGSPRSSATSLEAMEERGICRNDDIMSNNDTAQSNNASAEHAFHTISDEKEKQINSLLPTYLESVTKIRMIILAQSRSFWYLLPRWVYRAFSPMYGEEESTMGPIRDFARLTCENAVPGSPLALLGQRVSHSAENRDGAASMAEQNNVANISKDLLDEAITLLFAGQDTSAATLSWTLHLLSLHPAKQKRVANEVRSVLVKAGTNKPILKSMISQMPYLDAVIKESMRLYPVAPFIVRKLTADVAIPSDEELCTNQEDIKKSTTVPASTFACIWIYALHRNPKLWDRPNQFLPERWIDPELRGRDLGQDEYGSYMPFAIGPRNCLGQPLAQVILRILLARILNKFEVYDPKLEALQRLGKNANDEEFDPSCLRKDMQAGFTVLPSNGLKLRLIERR